MQTMDIMTKDDIRKNILSKRNSLTKEEILKKSRRIFETLIKSPEYQDARNILIYASMGSEVRTDDIIENALAAEKNVFCPKCTDTKNGIMEFVKIGSLSDLEKGYFGIREPMIGSDSVIYGTSFSNREIAEATLMVMPLVAYDDENNRIGYKGGYYDRFLKRFDNLKTIALAFKVQHSDKIIPSEAHDVKPEFVLSD